MPHFAKALFGLLVALILCGSAGCGTSGTTVPGSIGAAQMNKGYLMRIVDVQPESTVERADRIRWKIEAEVIEKPRNENQTAPAMGDHVIILVHSVSLTFGMTRNDIVGKKFLIIYESEFKNPYTGALEATAVDR